MRGVVRQKGGCAPDEEERHPAPCEPTDATAGSKDKIEVLRRRVGAGQQLWHGQDGKRDNESGCQFAKPEDQRVLKLRTGGFHKGDKFSNKASKGEEAGSSYPAPDSATTATGSQEGLELLSPPNKPGPENSLSDNYYKNLVNCALCVETKQATIGTLLTAISEIGRAGADVEKLPDQVKKVLLDPINIKAIQAIRQRKGASFEYLPKQVQGALEE